jgi:hypothetical protein
MTKQPTDNQAIKLVKWIIDKAVEGLPPLSSAADLAQEYLIDKSYPNNLARTDSLINWETAKNFTSGFITGLGGLITLPVSVPSALGASWIIQGRMSGSIAVIYGHNLQEDRVRTLVLLSLLGDAGKEVLKDAGIKIGQKITQNIINKIPGKVLIEINKKVGFRLITKAGEKGIINLIKCVPVAGGIIGGAFDSVTCRTVGYAAQKIFGENK